MAGDMRTLGYICPKCGAPVMGARSIFALEASDAEICLLLRRQRAPYEL